MNTVATQIAVSVVLGGALGMGLWSLLATIPRWGAQPLIRRVAPYIRDISDPQGTSLPAVAPADPASFVVGGAKRAWSWLIRHGAMLWGGSDKLASRIGRAGWAITPAKFRERQLGAALAAALVGAGLALAARLLGNPNSGVFALPIIFAIGAVLASDFWLSRAGNRRRAQVEDELPTILEFLALCLSAGEGLLDAIRRTASVGVGELSGELRAVVLHVSTGAPLADALTDFSRRIDVPGVQRAVEHLVAAIDRGAPLAAVLKDQAADARDEHKRTLMERAGKNEVLMLIPLVFLILPLSVAIAIFPGIEMLGVGFN